VTADYWKRWPVPLTFANPGDEATGEIIATGDLRDKCPELHIRQADGIVRIVRITHARLHELLGELTPGVGDRVRIRYTGDAEKALPGMNPAKEFTVEIKRQGSQPLGGTDNATSGEVKRIGERPEAGK
jgi:hypothetical protein